MSLNCQCKEAAELLWLLDMISRPECALLRLPRLLIYLHSHPARSVLLLVNLISLVFEAKQNYKQHNCDVDWSAHLTLTGAMMMQYCDSDIHDN